MEHSMYVVPEYVIDKLDDILARSIKHPDSNLMLQKLDYPKYSRNSVGEQCKLLGIKNYDISIPQPWYDKFYKITGMNPYGSIVWSFENNCFGSPVAITREAKVALDIFNRITKISLED